MDRTRARLAWLAAVTAWALAPTAEAQDVLSGEPLPEGDWMTSGLAPLVLLLALGIIVALVAAGVAAALMRTPRARSRA